MKYFHTFTKKTILMVRTILTPEHTDIHLTIPETYVGKPVEVTFLALEELERQPQATMNDFFGLLPDDTYSLLKQHAEQARKEWDRNF
jgi:hypothetical protein